MRKREVEKILYRAVAEALGVKTEELEQVQSKRTASARKGTAANEQRAAA
jgi:hypothetical protein